MVYSTRNVNSISLVESDTDSALEPTTSALEQTKKVPSFFRKLTRSVRRSTLSRKRVRFAPMPMLEEVNLYDEGHHDTNVQDAWYTNKEFNIFRADRLEEAKSCIAKVKASAIAKKNASKNDAISRTFDHCCKGGSGLPPTLFAELELAMRDCNLLGVEKLTSKKFCYDAYQRQIDLTNAVRDVQKQYQSLRLTKEGQRSMEMELRMVCERLTVPQALLAHHIARAASKSTRF